MGCFIVATEIDDSWMAPLRGLAGQVAHPVTVSGGLDALAADPAFLDDRRPIVLLPDRTPEGRLAADAVAFAGAQAGHAFLVYVADAIPAETYKHLVRGRSAEWITWAALARELPELVRGMAVADPADGGARIVSCVPSKGGVGNTTLAIEIAAHLAGRRKRGGARVAVLDLDLRGGTLADCLDVEPRLDVGEFAGRPERLDEQLIDVFTSRYSARLDVFASPIGSGPPDAPDPTGIFGFLDAIAARYDVVVLDIPHQGPPWLDNILQGSDAIVVSGGPTVPAIRQLTGTLARLDRIPVRPERIVVAVNQCDADLFGRIAKRAEIDRALAGRHVLYVRRDCAAVRGAQDIGRPLAETAPSKAVGRDVRRVAERVEMLVGEPGTRPGPATAAGRHAA